MNNHVAIFVSSPNLCDSRK